jgi:hypothetical protein
MKTQKKPNGNPKEPKKSKSNSDDFSQRLLLSPELYRAGLSCRIGRDIIAGEVKPPNGLSVIEYAIFNLLHAVEDIALSMEKEKTQTKPNRNPTETNAG